MIQCLYLIIFTSLSALTRADE